MSGNETNTEETELRNEDSFLIAFLEHLNPAVPEVIMLLDFFYYINKTMPHFLLK